MLYTRPSCLGHCDTYQSHYLPDLVHCLSHHSALEETRHSASRRGKAVYLVHPALDWDLCSSLSFVEAKGLAPSHTGNLCGSVLHLRKSDKIS